MLLYANSVSYQGYKYGHMPNDRCLYLYAIGGHDFRHPARQANIFFRVVFAQQRKHFCRAAQNGLLLLLGKCFPRRRDADENFSPVAGVDLPRDQAPAL